MGVLNRGLIVGLRDRSCPNGRYIISGILALSLVSSYEEGALTAVQPILSAQPTRSIIA
jgi:hypothetical protein